MLDPFIKASKKQFSIIKVKNKIKIKTVLYVNDSLSFVLSIFEHWFSFN